MGVVVSKQDFLIMELFNDLRRYKIVYWIQIWNQILKQTSRSWDLRKLSYIGQENSRCEYDYLRRAYKFLGGPTDLRIITTAFPLRRYLMRS